MTPTSTVTVTPLTSSIGARVSGVDLYRALDEGTTALIRDAFAEHGVLVFPNDAPIGPEEQTRLASVFGEPQPLAIFQFLGAPKPITHLGDDSGIKQPLRSAPKRGANSDLRVKGDNDGWHTDSSFTPWLPRAAVLRSEVIPPKGGDTSFVSLQAAFAGLSPVMQDFLQTLRAIHTYTPYYKEAINVWQYGDDAEARFDAEYPPREHPLVVRHPETGKPALFLNPVYTAQIAGMTGQESAALLRFLFQHVTSTEYMYRHHWTLGDVVVWDELTNLHRAPTDFAPHKRKVVRVTAGRTYPTAYRAAQ
jgi:taurine dioxygenase